jgi:hypothetical protein
MLRSLLVIIGGKSPTPKGEFWPFYLQFRKT